MTVVDDHRVRQARLAQLVARRARSAWQPVTVDNVNAWQTALPRFSTVVAAAQWRAARDAEQYVSAALVEQGVDVAPVARVVPEGFVGRASDGRPLVSLLDQPRIGVLTDIAAGLDRAEAVARGGRRLELMAVSTVQDTGRQADQVAIFTRPDIGYVRVVSPPCCQRCAILAGKWFESNAGFARHPRCDCSHLPSTREGAQDVPDARSLFESGQVRGLNAGETRAINDGADFNQVVNSRRRSSGMTTTEGTTRRGFAGRRLEGRQRLTPDAIYRVAPDRDTALGLLRRHGYLT